MMKIDKNTCEDFWDNQAEKIGDNVENHFQSGMLEQNLFHANFRKNMEESNFNSIIDISDVKAVLELGCGSGRWASYLSDKVESITAVDFSEKMIQLAKNNQNTSSAYSNVKYIQDKAQSFLVNNKFDLIYLSSVMQYLADDDIRMMIKHVKQMSHDETVLLTRDSVSILNDSFCKEGDYPVIYRTLADYNKLLNAEGFL